MSRLTKRVGKGRAYAQQRKGVEYRQMLYKLADYEDAGKTPLEVTAWAKAEKDGRILPEGFACLLLSNGKQLVVWHPVDKMVEIRIAEYVEVPAGFAKRGE